MTTLISLVVLTSPSLRANPVPHRVMRHAVVRASFEEHIRFALGEAWRLMVG